VQTFSDTGKTIQSLQTGLIALKKALTDEDVQLAAFVSTRVLQGVNKLGSLNTSCAIICVLTRALVEIEMLKELKIVTSTTSWPTGCQPGTRKRDLESVTKWLTSPSSQNILWLHGVVGSGKSTVAATLAHSFSKLHRLGAFICLNVKTDPNAIIPTIVNHLVKFDATIGEAIKNRINKDTINWPIQDLFTELLLEPLASLPEPYTKGPIIIIIDALDKCDDPASRKDFLYLLTLLAKEFGKLPPAFRFLITSRDVFDISAAFANRPNIKDYELDVNISDISLYVRHQLTTLQQNSMFGLPSDWPKEGKTRALIKASAGLFVWAETAVAFVENSNSPQVGLDNLLDSLSRGNTESPLENLYDLYKTALDTAGKWSDKQFAEDCPSVLGAIVVGSIPLPYEAIDQLLGLSGGRTSRLILHRLRCLLRWTEEQPARVLHVSFAEYLVDKRWRKTHPWFIDVTIHHRRLALACFRAMKDGLQFNICSLETSYVFNDNVHGLDDRVKSIHVHLSYACRFWADHLTAGFTDDSSLKTPRALEDLESLFSALNDFLHCRLLYWLEVLSLIKEVPAASKALSSVTNWIEVRIYYTYPTYLW
jgi:hypothetical protein